MESNSMQILFWMLVAFIQIATVKRTTSEEIYPCESPIYCYGDLLDLVQRTRVFPDSKTFVDMPMRADIDTVLAAFDGLRNRTAEGIHEFVNKWFDPVGSDIVEWYPTDWQENPDIIARIENTKYREWASDLNSRWKEFGKQVTRSVHELPDQHSLLAVNHPFIAPGGRFREFYYWDSYWIIRGLLLCGMTDTVKGMIRNMAQLIEEFGFVPNGGRTYYTMRSQPPLLTWMVSDYYQTTGDLSLLQEVLPLLDEEYTFWMTNRSITYSGCDCVMNYYSSTVTVPRPESYFEDVTVASDLLEDSRPNLYSNLASGAESGWDYSSRWFRKPHTLSSIRTRQVIPVDLNAFMGINEILLERLHNASGQLSDMAAMYSQAFQERIKNFDKVFWNEHAGLWSDRIVDSNGYVPGYYASDIVPMYLMSMANISNTTRDFIVLQTLEGLGVLDYPGGLPTSLNTSSRQQWDFPNAWPPLVWLLVKGMRDSGNEVLRQEAEGLASTWLNSNYDGWRRYNGSMFEKYDCTLVGEPGSGGEYSVQSGFGWTNGIVLDLLHTYPLSSPAQSTSQSTSHSLIVTLVVLLALVVCIVLVSIPCVCWCRWLYVNGKQRYWARVRNEMVQHHAASSNTGDSYDISVFENPGAKEWTEDRNGTGEYYDVEL